MKTAGGSKKADAGEGTAAGLSADVPVGVPVGLPGAKTLAAAFVFFGIMAALTIAALPYIRLLAEPETQQKFREWIISLGMPGWFVIFGIQVLQIVIAFIPGEPVEILAGVMYGGFGGLLTCLAGCALASSLVFVLARKFGTPLVSRLFRKKRFEEFAFIKDSRKLETVVFISFLLPGTPKDMLTYIAGTSPIKLSRFLLISLFARIPSILSSTLIGSTLWQGEWKITVLIFAVTAITGLAGILYRERILKFCRRIGHRLKDARHGNENRHENELRGTEVLGGALHEAATREPEAAENASQDT